MPWSCPTTSSRGRAGPSSAATQPDQAVPGGALRVLAPDHYVGAVESIADGFLVPAIARFRRDHPAVALSIRTGHTS